MVLDSLIADTGPDGQTRLRHWLAVPRDFQLNLSDVTVRKKRDALFNIETGNIVMQLERN